MLVFLKKLFYEFWLNYTMAANKSLALALGFLPNTVSLRKKTKQNFLYMDHWGWFGYMGIRKAWRSFQPCGRYSPPFWSALSLLWDWCHPCFMPIAPCIQLALTLLLAPALPCFRARLSLLFPTSLAPSSFLVSRQAQLYTDQLEVWVWRNRVWADIRGYNIIHQFLPCTGHQMDNSLSSKGNSFLSFWLPYASISRWEEHVGVESDPEHFLN